MERGPAGFAEYSTRAAWWCSYISVFAPVSDGPQTDMWTACGDESLDQTSKEELPLICTRRKALGGYSSGNCEYGNFHHGRRVGQGASEDKNVGTDLEYASLVAEQDD